MHGLLVAGEKSVLAGESQSGKSFLATDLAMALVRGMPFLHYKVPSRMGVVYVAAESGAGVVNLRAPAYRKFHKLADGEELPIVFLTQGPDLFSSDTDTQALIKDIHGHAASWDVPLGLVVIDTFAAATPGLDEVKGGEVSKVMTRVDQIREATNAHVMLVHHMNAEGSKVRGHTSIVANVDSVLIVSKTEAVEEGTLEGKPDQKVRRTLRELTTFKQKDGENGGKTPFVLRAVFLGQDDIGDITSCVVTPPESAREAIEEKQRASTPGAPIPRGAGYQIAWEGLLKALLMHGRPPPQDLTIAPADASVIKVVEWRDAIAQLAAREDEEKAALTERAKKIRDRAIETFLRDKLINKDGLYVWRTRKRVAGDPAPVVRKKSAPPDAATQAELDAAVKEGLPFA